MQTDEVLMRVLLADTKRLSYPSALFRRVMLPRECSYDFALAAWELFRKVKRRISWSEVAKYKTRQAVPLRERR